jgi:hypothetical protein
MVHHDSEENNLLGNGKGRSSNINSPEKSEQLINKAVKKILEKFPPPGK